MKTLRAYAKKRNFSLTPEPPGEVATAKGHSFVVQKHAARKLHYDFRLELDGVLKSWAVPKGPSLDPGDRRLAVEVEDHPVGYRDFEGIIPKGQYGGGEVIVWDRGTWTPIGEPHEALKKGHLRFILHGQKLRGGFSLVRMGKREGDPGIHWLLVKSADEEARHDEAAAVTLREPQSVITGRQVEDLSAVPKPPPFRAPVEPQLATLADAVPTTKGWLYELKYDGYRTLSAVDGPPGERDVRLYSRNGKDWSTRFSGIADAVRKLRVRNALLDGEVCYLDEEGKSSFQGLQDALSEGDQRRLVYFVFDILYRDGEDLRERPLLQRKENLETVLAGVDLPLRFSVHEVDGGEPILMEACRLHLEGVIAKRMDAPYRSGRTRTWIKLKCTHRQELVIVGFTAPKGKRSGLGALVLGVHPKKGEALRFVGKVGTGFSESLLLDLYKKLKPLARKTPPVEGAPRLRDGTWVEPKLVAEVGYTEWTQDGALRHPTFIGLREDKAPMDVVREKAVPPPSIKTSSRSRDTPETAGAAKRAGRRKGEASIHVGDVTITHPSRVVDEASGTTKGDLAHYYHGVEDLLFPYAKKRPLVLVRCPDGIDKECFFQKHVRMGTRDALIQKNVGDQQIVAPTQASALIRVAQFGAVEMHGWGSRLPHLEKPDWLVLDFDPDVGLDFHRVVEAALEAREVFASVGLTSWVKTTGGKGLHVVAPFRPRYGWDIVKTFARVLAELFVQRSPDKFTATLSKAARKGKIFVDYLRNAEGATAVLPYSARARPQVPVAMPLAWEDLGHIHPLDFTTRTVPAWVKKRRRDPWAHFFATPQDLPPHLERVLEKA